MSFANFSRVTHTRTQKYTNPCIMEKQVVQLLTEEEGEAVKIFGSTHITVCQYILKSALSSFWISYFPIPFTWFAADPIH